MGRKAKTLIIAAVALVLSVCMALADPPTPHSIAGYIYETGGINQVPLYTTYDINESVSKAYVLGQTSIHVPGMSGRYFAIISGVTGDLTIVRAWNITHFGNASALLQDALDNVNVHLNMTRFPEANVSLLYPANNTFRNSSTYFNVTANITVLGSNGSSCYATLNFSDESAFELGSEETAIHQLGNINTTTYVTTIWNLSSIMLGDFNITVSAACLNQSYVLERKDVAWVNASFVDITPPVVRLMSPSNNTYSTTTYVAFTFNVSEAGPLANCSLIINDQINMTNTTLLLKSTPQSFISSAGTGAYNWSINCTDIYGNTGASRTYNLTVNATGPRITGVSIRTPINLQAATAADVQCNASLVLGDITNNVLIINATLYDPLEAGMFSQDDNNNHYTNTSCEQTGKNGVDENYTCSFNLMYYANNATWVCNFTAMDEDNMTAAANNSTLINELVSFAINSSVLDYGLLNVTNTSGIRNITMYNYGNKALNISVLGFAVEEDDTLAMVCDMNTNISIGFERYSVDPEISYEEMINLTSSSVMVANFTLQQRTNDLAHGHDANSTYWRISVPPPAASNCSGVISLAAIKA
jgi:hypothetical protein